MRRIPAALEPAKWGDCHQGCSKLITDCDTAGNVFDFEKLRKLRRQFFDHLGACVQSADGAFLDGVFNGVGRSGVIEKYRNLIGDHHAKRYFDGAHTRRQQDADVGFFFAGFAFKHACQRQRVDQQSGVAARSARRILHHT